MAASARLIKLLTYQGQNLCPRLGDGLGRCFFGCHATACKLALASHPVVAGWLTSTSQLMWKGHPQGRSIDKWSLLALSTAI